MLVQVMTDRNKNNFEQHRIYTSAHDSPIVTVLFHNAKRAFGLNRTVCSQKRALDAVEIIKNLSVHGRQFFVYSYRSVFWRLFTCARVWTPGAIFTLKDFFLTNVPVSFYILPITEMKGFPVRTAHNAVLIDSEILRAVRVLVIPLIFAFFVVHGEFHIFLHAVLFAVYVVVV